MSGDLVEFLSSLTGFQNRVASICKVMTLAVRGLSSGGGGLSVLASEASGRRCESGHLLASHIERPTLNNYRYQYEAIDTYS